MGNYCEVSLKVLRFTVEPPETAPESSLIRDTFDSDGCSSGGLLSKMLKDKGPVSYQGSPNPLSVPHGPKLSLAHSSIPSLHELRPVESLSNDSLSCDFAGNNFFISSMDFLTCDALNPADSPSIVIPNQLQKCILFRIKGHQDSRNSRELASSQSCFG